MTESDLEEEGFLVEKRKAKKDKIKMIVHVGNEDKAILFFEVDAWREEAGIVIEVLDNVTIKWE